MFFGFVVVVIHAAVFQRRSIVLSRSFQLILQHPFLGEYGKNLGVSVGEMILRHSEKNEGQFAFSFKQGIAARLTLRQIQELFSGNLNALFCLFRIWGWHGQLGGCIAQDGFDFEEGGFHI
ncbi:MAG: hypothetical protein ABSF10_16025 [Verrucomicrobiota bacterium]